MAGNAASPDAYGMTVAVKLRRYQNKGRFKVAVMFQYGQVKHEIMCISYFIVIGEDPNNSNRMISARRSLVTERSERTGEEAQCFLSYNEQIRAKATS